MRVGLESPSSFEGPGTSCSGRVRIVLPRPSAAHVYRYQKRSLSSSMHTPPTTKYSHQVAFPCSSKYTKMHIIASDFSKIFRGSMPPDPPSGAQATPQLLLYSAITTKSKIFDDFFLYQPVVRLSSFFLHVVRQCIEILLVFVRILLFCFKRSKTKREKSRRK